MYSHADSVSELQPTLRAKLPAGRPATAVAPANDLRPARGRARRVLMIVESAGGGTGRHVLDLSEGLADRGCEVHLIYSTNRIDRMFSDRLSALRGVRHTAVPMRTSPHPSDLGVVFKVRRYMKANGPFDVVHGHSSKGGAIARLAAFGTGASAFYTLHGLIMMDPLLPWWKWLLYLSIELGLSLRTGRIIAVSPEESRAAVRLGLGRTRTVMVPNGVGPADLAPRDLARRALKVPDDAVVIGFVGRLVEQKAPEVLLRAFAATAQAAPHVRLAMVGAGPLDASLLELAGRLDIADKILWLGERDARGVLAAFDIFALSSRKEGLPYVVLEAMAAGLPVVATSSAGVEILIEPGVSGAVVAPDDVNAFSAALTELALSPQRLAECGRASYERSLLFTLDAMADRTLDAYLSVAGKAGVS
ncbi:MAG: glycosyl transferase group 1 [Phycisphaerales bacterium]|nr:glycosyl transferase group 1 [Phycisphaerales bacterium]